MKPFFVETSVEAVFGPREIEVVRLSEANAAITAARIEGAKAMQERCEKILKDEMYKNWPMTIRQLAKAIAAIDPATVGGGG